MTLNGWMQILLFAVIVLAITKPLGIYMFRVLEGDRQPLPRFFGPIERCISKLCSVDSTEQQDWKQYTVGLLVFSAVTLLVTYGIERLQHILPLNPQKFPPVPADLAFNTAVSFTTNTNWQNYAGESVMSYLTQMAGLAWHNFLSAGVGLCVALALARGITYRLRADAPKMLGNFWVDLIRSLVYIFIPICIPVTLLLVSQGVIQNFSSYVDIATLEGGKQSIAMGPVASQEVIKELGTNGGGFFNANSAHPFENPTPLSDMLLRQGSRLAGRLNTDWFVVHIETKEEANHRIDATMQRYLLDDEQRARDLGAEVVRLRSEKPVDALLEFARDHDRRSLLINLAIQSFRFQQAALQDGFQNLSLLVTKQRLQ